MIRAWTDHSVPGRAGGGRRSCLGSRAWAAAQSEQAGVLGDARRGRTFRRLRGDQARGGHAVPHGRRLRLYLLTAISWNFTDTCCATLSKRPPEDPGTTYTCTLTVTAEGEHAVRAFHYRRGKPVATSADHRASTCARPQIPIDSMVNGWMAPSLGRHHGPRRHAAGHRVHHPGRLGLRRPGEALNGAAHFIWGDFEKVDADGLIWHTDGLRPAATTGCATRCPSGAPARLVVSQRIDIDKTSHADTHALPYLPADISFGDVSSEGMGCDRSIAFLTRIFAQTSPDPLVWHTDGLVPGRYDWKCWMDECHYGTLVADGACPAGAHRFGPPGLGDGGARGHAGRHGLHRREDDVLADHPLHDGGRLHEDEGISRIR